MIRFVSRFSISTSIEIWEKTFEENFKTSFVQPFSKRQTRHGIPIHFKIIIQKRSLAFTLYANQRFYYLWTPIDIYPISASFCCSESNYIDFLINLFQINQCQGGARRCLTEARDPSFNGEKIDKNPPLRHFACILRHNITFLPVETRNSCLCEASSGTTSRMVWWKMLTIARLVKVVRHNVLQWGTCTYFQQGEDRLKTRRPAITSLCMYFMS